MTDTTNFQLRAPTPLVGALDDLAARSGRSRNAEIVAALEAHARAQGAGTGLEAGLEETHAAYRAHRDRLRASLDELGLDVDGASLIVDALNGHGALADATGHLPGPAMLYAEVADAIKLQGLDRKHGVDGRAFLQRARKWTPLQALAVADAAERFWAAPEAEDTESVLRAVGLVQ